MFRRASFPNFEIVRFPNVRFEKNKFAKYGFEISKKTVLWGDPGQNGRCWGPFLVHWNFNISENHENQLARRLVRPVPAKVREKTIVWSVPFPGTPLDLLNFNLNYQQTSFCEKLDFSSFYQLAIRQCPTSNGPSLHKNESRSLEIAPWMVRAGPPTCSLIV
jgi:hypothetical protein